MIHLNELFYKILKCHSRKRKKKENENTKKKNLRKIQSEEKNREKKDLNLKEEMNEVLQVDVMKEKEIRLKDVTIERGVLLEEETIVKDLHLGKYMIYRFLLILYDNHKMYQSGVSYSYKSIIP